MIPECVSIYDEGVKFSLHPSELRGELQMVNTLVKHCLNALFSGYSAKNKKYKNKCEIDVFP